MSNKAEQLSKNSEKAKETPRAIEPPPLPQEALVKGQELVSELKASGRPRLERIAAEKGLPLEAQEVVETEAKLKPLEDEADEAVEVLESDILENDEGVVDLEEGDYVIVGDIDLKPTRRTPVPPPIPEDARRSQTVKSIPSLKEKPEEIQDRLKHEKAESIWKQLMDIYKLAKEAREDDEVKLSDIKLALIDVMHEMYQFSFKFVKPVGGEVDEEAENLLNIRLKVLTKMKTKVEAKVAGAFEEIFQEFGDIIDEHLVAEYIAEKRKKNESVSVEDATMVVYHRTPEEMERIKENNRKATAGMILDLAQENEITTNTVEKLHAANNKGIVPREVSKLRSKTGVNVSFFKRFGTLSEHVEEAMADLMVRANKLIAAERQGMSNLRYGIEAAKLHNDLLDIHPFADRNGSTSLLFLETLMARRGYVPDTKRQKSYYKNLNAILGGNMIAVGVVGYQQVVIAQKFGYYEIPRIVASPELKKRYEEITSGRKLAMKKESMAYRQAMAKANNSKRAKGENGPLINKSNDNLDQKAA